MEFEVVTANLNRVSSFDTSILDPTPFLKSPRLPEIAAALNSRLQLESANRQRFYEEMTDSEKVEFIDGEILMHSPARYEHLAAKMNLSTLLNTHLNLHKLGLVRDEKCLCVFPRNDYEPDIIFFGREKSPTIHRKMMKYPIPDFVVEVLSDSTENRDRGVKFEDYEADSTAQN